MASNCAACRDGAAFTLPFSMAFQPIVDVETRAVFAYEALVRGPANEAASTVLSRVDESNRYAFDQQCRVKAIEFAAALGIATQGARLSINFLPNAVYEPRACIRLTLEAAQRVNFPLDKIMFEFTEQEEMNVDHINKIVSEYSSMGFTIALDDFGAGHSGLGLLTRIQPDVVKIDMELVRDIDTNARKRTILKNVIAMLDDLGTTIVCEGVETDAEFATLRSLGVRLIQGYVLAKPAFESLPPLTFHP